MSFLDKFFGIEERGADYIISPADVFGIGLDQLGKRSTAGVRVNDETPYQIAAAWRCINILVDVIATQSCGQFIKEGGVFVPSQNQPDFLDFDAGIFTKIQVIGAIVSSIATSGNAYTATHRGPGGEVVWLEPLDPQAIGVIRRGNEKRFTVNGHEFIEGQPITTMDILHIPGLLLAGSMTGVSPTEALRETLGLTVAATEFGAGFFGNGALPGAVLEVEGDMSPAGKQGATRTWNAMYQGAGNSKKLAVLTHGAKLKTVSIPPNEAQFLQTREFQVPEIARMYGVPPSLLGHSMGPEMGKSIEDKAHQFNQYTLTGWFGRIQEGFTWLSHSEGGDRRTRIRFDTETLERGNMSAFVENGTTLVREGVLTINELREKLGKPPVDWGDEPISVQVQVIIRPNV